MGENSTSYKNSAAGRYVCAVTLTPEPASPHQNWTRKEHVHSTIDIRGAVQKKQFFSRTSSKHTKKLRWSEKKTNTSQ
jgi:hypothetical protein